MLTVDQIRGAIRDLPGSSVVLIKTGESKACRCGADVTGAHDGRYGPVLLLTLGEYIAPFNSVQVKQEG